MGLTCQDLCHLRAHGFSLTAVIVCAYLLENGARPAAAIAEACDISERSVYLALRLIKDSAPSPIAGPLASVIQSL